MKYRSYNSEILIATTLICDVFNDIIIDRRTHRIKQSFFAGNYSERYCAEKD